MEELKARITRRRLLEFVAGSSAMAALAACARPTATPLPKPADTKAPAGATVAPKATETKAPAAATVAPKDPVTIRWWQWADEEEAKSYNLGVEGFVKQNPLVKVVFEYQPWGDYHTKLLTALSAGTAPDLYAVATWFMSDYVEKKQAFDITPFLEQDGEYRKWFNEQYPEELRKQVSWKGKQWGFPFGCSTHVVWYNYKLFEQAGVQTPYEQYKAGKWDLKAFRETAKALTKTDKNGKITQYGASISGNWNYILNIVWALGGQDMDMSAEPSKTTFHTPQFRQAFEYVRDLVQTDHSMPRRGETGDVDIVMTGMCAMFNEWEGADNIYNDKEHMFDIAPLPSGPAGRFAITNANPYLVNVTSKQPREAYELEKYLVKEGELMYVKRGRYFYLGPASYYELPEFLSKYKARPNTLPAENRRKFSRSAPQPPGNREMRTAVNKEISLYLANEKTLDAAIQVMQKEGDRILAEAIKK